MKKYRIIIPVVTILTAFGIGVAYNVSTSSAQRGNTSIVMNDATPTPNPSVGPTSIPAPVDQQAAKPTEIQSASGTVTPSSQPAVQPITVAASEPTPEPILTPMPAITPGIAATQPGNSTIIAP